MLVYQRVSTLFNRITNNPCVFPGRIELLLLRQQADARGFYLSPMLQREMEVMESFHENG